MFLPQRELVVLLNITLTFTLTLNAETASGLVNSDKGKYMGQGRRTHTSKECHDYADSSLRDEDDKVQDQEVLL